MHKSIDLRYRKTVESILQGMHSRHSTCTEGKLADYIPELTLADPEWFGISLHSVDGKAYSVGDFKQEFTIQSVPKAFIYGMILDDHGYEAVSKKIGVEPSGEAFNSIRLDPDTGQPLNPMINAGAIAATGMVEGEDQQSRFERIKDKLSAYAGRELGCDMAVYQSESATGFRNRAIANLLRNFEIIGDPVRETTEVYFQQCAILVSCEDLAMMGACLANGGVNPATGKRVLKTENVDRVLSVMSTCGMYDYSGAWIFDVGLPAKSGVGGGVVGVLPGQFGFSVFSPRLDEKGNSVRGLRVFGELSKRFSLHLFKVPSITNESVRRNYSLRDVDSKRQRPKDQRDTISEHGDLVQVIEMQGDLFFGSTERMLRMISDFEETPRCVVLDLHRVTRANEPTVELIETVADDLAEADCQVILVDPNCLFERERVGAETTNVAFANELESALESCERKLLQEFLNPPLIVGLIPFHEFEVFEGFDAREFSIIEGLLEMEVYRPHDLIVEQGADADYLYLLAKGSVSVFVGQDDDETGAPSRRLAAFCPGVVFGDLGILDGGKRSANVVADEYSTCYLLPAEKITKLEQDHPSIYTKILRNILKLNINRLRSSNQEIISLRG